MHAIFRLSAANELFMLRNRKNLYQRPLFSAQRSMRTDTLAAPGSFADRHQSAELNRTEAGGRREIAVGPPCVKEEIDKFTWQVVYS